MIRTFSLIGLAFWLISVTSCQKELTFENADNTDTIQPPTQVPTGNQKLYRIQQGVDSDLNNDTVLIIAYDAAGKIETIVDSLYQDTITVNYDAAGKLTGASANSGGKVRYVYDSNNQLTEISYTWAGSKEKYVFSYTGATVQKKSYYSDLGSGGALKFLADYIYTTAGGNITSISEYTAGGALVSTRNFAYGSDPNPFKELSLFNYGNGLGMDYIMNIETYFNKNLWTRVTIPPLAPGLTNLYTFNLQRLTKAVSNDGSAGVFTWQFYYK